MVLLTKGPVLYVGDLFILWLGAFTCNPLVPLPTPIPHRDCVLERNVKENKKATARGHSLGLAGPAKATKVTEATSGDSDHQAPNGTAVMVAGKLCPGQGVLRSSATCGEQLSSGHQTVARPSGSKVQRNTHCSFSGHSDRSLWS